MVPGGEVELHVKCFSERAEKSGYELGASIRGNMFGNAMFGEYVHNEQCCKVFGRTMNGCRDEDTLF